MITLAVDAMGGDSGLAVTAPGAAAFLKQQRDVRLIMVGDEAAVRKALAEAARRGAYHHPTRNSGGGNG